MSTRRKFIRDALLLAASTGLPISALAQTTPKDPDKNQKKKFSKPMPLSK